MSLYGGIILSGETKIAPELANLESTSSSSAASNLNSNSTTTNSAETDTKAKPAAWSAALRFAPTIRKKVVSNQLSNNTIPLSLQSAFNNGSEDMSNRNNAARNVGTSQSALNLPTIAAPPSLYSNNSSTISALPNASTSATTIPIRSGRILQAPSMTLDEEDVNGFRQTAKGKRSTGKQTKGKKKKGVILDSQLGFDDTLYEPSKPCDYSAYKAHLQAQRTQRRLDREEERRRENSPSGSSYYSSGEERSGDEQKSSKKARFFAPPVSYNSPPPTSNEELPMLTPATYTSSETSQANLNAAPRAETGEEAYLRRVALSAGGALKQQPSQPQYPTFSAASTSSGPSFSSAPTLSIASTSYNMQLPPPPSNFIQPPSSSTSSFQNTELAFPPFRPSSQPSSSDNTPPLPPLSIPLSDAAARARDIAQRLGKLAALQPPSLPSPPIPSPSGTENNNLPDDNRPFAERLMSKFGWKEGQGLGAEESGMTSALSVSKPSLPPHPSSKKGKKAVAEGTISNNLPAGMGASVKGGGKIIDAARSDRNAKQTAEMGGEPSRVVLLTNIVGKNDIDDDLGGEIAEEASKFGVVDRCFVYLVPGEERDAEAVRIFLVMSGLAGGYNAVRNFNGRFFGGRVVKAVYYDERTFQSGEHRM